MGAQNFAKNASVHPLTGILNLLTTRHFCPSQLSSFKNMLLQLVRNSALNTRVFFNPLVDVWISDETLSFSCLIYHFSVLGYQMKHFFSCSIYYFWMFWYQIKRFFSCLISYFSMFGYLMKHSFSWLVSYFSVFGNQMKRSFSCLIYNMKHCISCLIYYLNTSSHVW